MSECSNDWSAKTNNNSNNNDNNNNNNNNDNNNHNYNNNTQNVGNDIISSNNIWPTEPANDATCDYRGDRRAASDAATTTVGR